MSDTSRIIQRIMKTPLGKDERILILQDNTASEFISWCRFNHPYDRCDLGPICHLFEQTVNTIGIIGNGSFFTEHELPMVGMVGKYRYTLVTRLGQDEYTVKDMSGESPAEYMGL